MAHSGGAAVERSALDQQVAGGPKFNSRPAGYKKSFYRWSPSNNCGQAVYTHYLGGVVAVHEGYMAAVRYGADL